MMSVVAGGELIKVDCGSGALGLTLVTDYVIMQGTPITRGTNPVYRFRVFVAPESAPQDSLHMRATRRSH